MIPVRKEKESLVEFKVRLIEAVNKSEITAEDAFDAYEEAYLKEE
jgi:hypothetical protein